MNEEYNEEYISNLYNNNGGSKTFGSYNKFKELISQNDKYRHKVHTTIGETLGSYDDFVGNLKKKSSYGIRICFGYKSYFIGWRI